ncbi:hypothetical protein DKT68_26830 [Micromonospora acroterricola]|uniref:Integral membrane protein n=1 Tax=Micromonospora acroterricola TaxID=2202421 RepID=A0A317CTI3_9ACTN|nr:hypothetical protein [Micromonospora acroterricola]PWR05472.1 hypothetical protein DKT68_26830 [Micromonospora acroterricola]
MSEGTPSHRGGLAPHDIVELRVHGVSGARPERVLGRAHVQQIAGDSSGGFHRPVSGRQPGDTDPDGVALEAYRWGDLPSGTVARTLSLVLLLPFMLSNVAVWMRPVGRGSGSGVTVLCRLLALNLTALFVLSIAGVALDSLAWRCLGVARCPAPFAGMVELEGRQVGQRLAVLALLPVAAVVLLRLLGARRRRPVAHPLWAVEPLVGRLRAIHVATALAVLDLVLLEARSSGGGRTTASIVLLALTGAVLLVCVGLLAVPGLLDGAATARAATWTAETVRVLAYGISVAAFAAVALDERGWPPSPGLPGYGPVVSWAMLGQMALLVVLSGLVLWHYARGDRRSALPTGLGAAVVAAIAVGLAGAFSSDLVYQTGNLLGGYERDGGPPLPYQWTVLAFFLHVSAGVLLCGALTLTSRAPRWRAAAAITAGDFPSPPPGAAEQLKQVTRAIARARFTERLAMLSVAYAALAAIGLTTGVLGLFGLEPDRLGRLLGLPAGSVGFGLAVGSYLTASVVLALLLGGILAYRTAWFRRHVGILWDLGTFWPRAAHPFAPPSYADRAVPELVDRITQLAERHAGVLLCGHSHGSALLALAVLRLPPEVRQRVALLTYGSPLGRLYARLFPAYLNQGVLREVGERIGWRWLNLWRDTDPVGGWIFAAHRPGDSSPDPSDPAMRVDRRLRDPRDVLPRPGERRPPPLRGHQPGENDPEFRAAVRELVGRLRDPGRC